jgi:predicted GNAT superfamily acetyltransferase
MSSFFVPQAEDWFGAGRHTGAMPVNLEVSSLVSQAQGAAARAASRAGVAVVDASELDQLRAVEALLVTVWSTSPHAPPLPTDLLRSISHAGCNVTAAYTHDGVLCGAAVAIVSPGKPSMYSLIAGVLPGLADAGVGFALKQHQRAWALARGIETMIWTFDPLVSRNARFNLTKLGAHAHEYLENFYGPMDDGINANDVSDRLVAVWPLTSEESTACSEGFPVVTDLPLHSPADVRGTGPDGQPNLIDAEGSMWLRVPTDIVGLRGRDPALAATWRAIVRETFITAFARGRTARGVTRSGWYKLAAPGEPHTEGQS